MIEAAPAEDATLPRLQQRLLADFHAHGHTDQAYLVHHLPRFASTLRTFLGDGAPRPAERVLDIGAHWLHQAWLWRREGHAVTALDLPATLSLPSVRSFAAAHGIMLLPCASLEKAVELEVLADDSVDIVLFTEILEHLTFNPLRLWTQLHRVLRPGGRIIVTTPNYYAWGARAWQLRRFLRGGGGGLGVDELLTTPTHGHHWREYSLSEVVRYFALLSPDFSVARLCRPPHFESATPSRLARLLQRHVPWLRPHLHVEIALTGKHHGITARATW